ncbi:cobalamin-binding protein [Herminiimonas sp. NPDC097707]|uniref:cobalamin-binding protein n=1 Tax=Herminiimonas sp. NPDC097707 TaxID=3364007 RepID=UPI00383ABD40
MKYFFVLACLLLPLHASATIIVQDDVGRTLELKQPAQRIVSLAPHATELLFAAGGGNRIVGAVEYSDYPAAALKIPRVGNYEQIDIERIIALKPDLLVVWPEGNAQRQLEPLRKSGIPFYYSEPVKLRDIPDSIVRLGTLMGTRAQAEKTAAAQRTQLAGLKARYGHLSPVRVFYQVSDQPLYTLSGKHILSDVIHLCGGINVFAKMNVTAPAVSVESVLLENPEVIMTGASKEEQSGNWKVWPAYQSLLAVKNHNLFSIDEDLLSRAGPRLIDGAALVCEKLERARSHRARQP